MSLLRQRSRPYLFSNSLPPAVVGCASKALDLLMESNAIVQTMAAKTQRCGPWQGWDRLGVGELVGACPHVPTLCPYHASSRLHWDSALLTKGCLPTHLPLLCLPLPSISGYVTSSMTLYLPILYYPVFSLSGLVRWFLCPAPHLHLALLVHPADLGTDHGPIRSGCEPSTVPWLPVTPSLCPQFPQ